MSTIFTLKFTIRPPIPSGEEPNRSALIRESGSSKKQQKSPPKFHLHFVAYACIQFFLSMIR